MYTGGGWLCATYPLISYDYLGRNEAKLWFNDMECYAMIFFLSAQWPEELMWIGRVCVYWTALLRQAFDQWCIFITRFELSAEYHAATGMLTFLAAYANYAICLVPAHVTRKQFFQTLRQLFTRERAYENCVNKIITNYFKFKEGIQNFSFIFFLEKLEKLI